MSYGRRAGSEEHRCPVAPRRPALVHRRRGRLDRGLRKGDRVRPREPGGLPLPRRALRKARENRRGRKDATETDRTEPELDPRLLLSRPRTRISAALRRSTGVLPTGAPAQSAIGAGLARPGARLRDGEANRQGGRDLSE